MSERLSPKHTAHDEGGKSISPDEELQNQQYTGMQSDSIDSSRSLTPSHIMSLQRMLGNRQVQRMLSKLPVRKNQASRFPIRGGGSLRSIVQRMRPDKAENDTIAETAGRLINAGNFALAKHAIQIRIDSGELDNEDVTYIGTSLKGTLPASEERLGENRNVEQKNTFSQGITGFLEWIQGMRTNEKAFSNLGQRVLGLALDPVGEPDEGEWREIISGAPERGRRIFVPQSQNTAVLMPLSDIKWSQKDVAAQTSDDEPILLTSVVSNMYKGGWRGKALEVVDMPDTYKTVPLTAGITSIDNRRLLAALTAGLKEAPVIRHAVGEACSPEWALEKQNTIDKNIWIKAGDVQAGGDPKARQREGYTVLMAKGYTPVTYGDLILVRTIKQGALRNRTDLTFPIGGSSEPPTVR
jgi:hypothetical protein